MIKKIIYFIIVVFFGIAVYYLSYQTDQYNHTLGIINDGIETKEYEKVVKVFSGLFDSESIIIDDTEEMDLRVYPGTKLTNIEYTKNDETTKHLNYEKAYHLYIFAADFALTTFLDSNSVECNYSGIRFVSTENTSYMYYFVVNSTINSDYYEGKPSNIIDAALKNDRDYATTEESLGFISIDFSKTMLDQIVYELKSPIKSIQIIDNENNVIYTHDIKLDFTDAFFVDCGDVIDRYSEAYRKYNNTNDANEQKQIIDEFERYYEDWIVRFENNNHPTYSLGYKEEELKPDYLYFESIDKMIIFLIIVILIYIIIFHRYGLKVLMCKIFRKDPPEDNRIVDEVCETSIEEDMIDVDNPK